MLLLLLLLLLSLTDRTQLSVENCGVHQNMQEINTIIGDPQTDLRNACAGFGMTGIYCDYFRHVLKWIGVSGILGADS